MKQTQGGKFRDFYLRYETTADLSVKCMERHFKVGTFIRNH